MSLVNHSVTNIINGVSQQSPALRLDNQVAEQVNCFSDVTKGLTIRNGIELTNVTRMDLDTSNVIEFTLDGEKVLMSLDPTAATPLTHIPLTADVQALTGAIPDLNYFQNIQKGDIRVLEDKDKVYILNTARKVGEVELGSSYVDVIISNNVTTGVDTNWLAGEYTLTIDGVEDPLGPATAIQQLVLTIDRTYSLADIAAEINGTAALIAETGECYVTGSVSSYRITFHSIPINYIAPTVVGLETVSIEASGNVITEDSGFVFSDLNNLVYRYGTGGIFQYYWGAALIASSWNTSVQVSGYTYERGTSPVYNKWYIRRYKIENITAEYSLEVQTPDETFISNAISSYPQEGMIWVTGVTSNQTYDVTIKYDSDTSGTPATPVVFATTSVGTTPANININWVAGNIQGLINAHVDFTAVQYDNAIHILTSGTNVITDIVVTNNYDNSSINSVIEAVENSTSGTLDVSTLPPIFLDDFKVRVGSSDESDSNYYLKYNSSFKGWRESGLDENRALDYFTMPHIINKEDVRKSGVVTIEHGTWVKASSGDAESNTSPSFVDKNIKDIFFYGSRLGIATDDTLIMSRINELGTFYRTTASQTVVSDRVDIKLDSSKVGFDTIKHVTIFNQSLFINTGTTQSKLLVNTAFDLTSARLTEVSSYSLGENQPLPVENGLYFTVDDGSFTSVINYKSAGGDTFDTEDLTRHCPTYIEGTVDRMVYAKNMAVVSIVEDQRVLYIQNSFRRGGEMLQNSWHKWTLPYDLKHIHFFNDELKIIMSTIGGYGYASGTTHTDQVLNFSDTSMFTVNDEVTVRESEQTANADFTSTIASIVPNVSITLNAASGYSFSDAVLVDNLQTFTIMSKYNLKPQNVTVAASGSNNINWTPYLDMYTLDKTLIDNFTEFIGIDIRNGINYANVVTAHLSTLVDQIVLSAETTETYSLVSAVYYWRVTGNLNEIVFNDGAVISFGNNNLTEYDIGGYRYYKGAEQTTAYDYGVYRATITASSFYTNNILYGVPFEASVTLSEIIARQETPNGPVVMNYANLMLRRMRLFLAKSGPFRVSVDFDNRRDYTIVFNGERLGVKVLGTASAEDFTFQFPANGKSDVMTITITTDSSTPFNLLSTEWQGQLITKGSNI